MIPGYRVELELVPGSEVWTDISKDVLGYRITRGRSSPGEDFAPGEITGLRLDNSKGDYDPDNETGAHWPNIRPNRRIRVWALAPDPFPRFLGFVNEWPSAWQGAYAETTLSANDGPKQLRRPLTKSVFELAVEEAAPVAWYRLGETAGTVMRDRFTNDGRYLGGATFNTRMGLVAKDPDPCINFSGAEMQGLIDHPTMDPGDGSFMDVMLVRLPTALTSAAGSFPARELFAVDAGAGRPWASRLTYDNNDVPILEFQTGTSGGGDFNVVSGPYPRDGARHMIVCRRAAGGTLQLRRDRSIIIASQTGPANTRRRDVTHIGRRHVVGGNAPIDLEIDEYLQFAPAISGGLLDQLYDAATTPWAQDTTAERAHRILDLADWPPAARDIGDGRSLVALDGHGAHVRTPDHASLRITGNIDLRMAVAMSFVHEGAGSSNTLTKWGSGQRGYILSVRADRRLHLFWSTNGSNGLTARSTVNILGSAQDGMAWGLRADLRVSDGRVRFFRKVLDLSSGAPSVRDQIDSNTGWDQLGDAVFMGATSIHASTAQARIGNTSDPSGNTEGHVLAAVIKNGIAGTTVADPDFTASARGATSVTDSTGKVWTLDGGARMIALGFEVSTAELVGRTPIEILHDLARSEFGGFYMLPDGHARLRTRYELASSAKLTISDLRDDPVAPAAVFYSQAIRDSASDQHVRNEVTVTPEDAPSWTERDQASIDEFLLRETEVRTLHARRGPARHVARLHLEPSLQRGLREVTFRLETYPEHAAEVLGCELEDRIAWRAHPPPEERAPLADQAFIQQIEDVVTRDSYEVTWTLAPVPTLL